MGPRPAGQEMGIREHHDAAITRCVLIHFRHPSQPQGLRDLSLGTCPRRQALPRPELFDVIVFSCEVGLRKPNPAIFRHACERLDVEPTEALP